MLPKKKPYVAPAPGGQSSQGGVAGTPIYRTAMPEPTAVVPVPVGEWVVAIAGPPMTLEEAIRLRAVAFAPIPEMFITIPRLEGSDLTNPPPLAAEVVNEISRLEEAEGGRGVVFIRDGSREEKGKLVLRLLPNFADAGATARFAKVAETLNKLTREAREHAAHPSSANGHPPGNGVLGQIEALTFASK